MCYSTKYYKDAIYVGEVMKKDHNTTLKNIQSFIRQGLGIDIHYKGFKIYEGNWKNGLPQGEGLEYRENGTVNYKGSWLNGEKNGYGKQLLQNGKIRYKGQFLKNTYFGFGSLFFIQKDPLIYIIEYEGEWQYGERNGFGKEYRNSNDKGISRRIKDEVNLKYLGHFKDDVFNGNGLEFWENGKVCIMSIKNKEDNIKEIEDNRGGNKLDKKIDDKKKSTNTLGKRKFVKSFFMSFYQDGSIVKVM